MTIEYPPLTEDLAGRLGKRKVHIREGGGRLNPVRLWTDKRVFQVKRPGPGGTAILDASGSMGLKPDDVFGLLRQYRGMTVACYSGLSTSGKLWILARNGRMVGTIPEQLGGNTVDGPALDWLIAQKARPKIWISDQQVIGILGAATSNLYADCCRKIKTGRLLTARDIPTAVKVLRRR
jgi:hypothetical protein